MKKIVILTESGADLSKELAEKLEIYVVPMHVVMENVDYLDGSILVTDIYDYHDRTKKIPTTSATNPHEYETIYETIREENPGCQILHISYTSKASSTYQNSMIASEGDPDIFHIDALNVTAGLGGIAIKAAELLKSQPDITMEDLIQQVESFVPKMRLGFLPGNLEYLKAGGRLSNAAYIGASLLQLKPMIELLDGKLMATKKYRGTTLRILDRFLNEYFERYEIDRGRLYFVYSIGLSDEAKKLAEKNAKEKGFNDIIWVEAGCVISTHSGPGAFGVAGFAV